MGASPLIGRERELQELERALEAALQGQGSSVLLVGEPGIGKSRLADELSTRARAAGATVAWGRAWESGGAPPLWPWREALGALQLEAALSTDEDDRFLRFARVEQAVRARCAQGPLVLVLDDLHAADTSTLELLVYLARTSRQRRLLLVGTTRDVEARQRPEVEGLLARFAREGVRLWLGRFSRDQVRALAEGLAAGKLPDAVLAQVFDATEGNPFFVDETVRGYLAQGATAVPRGLPEGVRAVLHGRLGLLSAAARAVLQTAGVLGRELDPAVLAQLHGDAAQALAEAEATGALVRREDGHLAFAHVLLAEALRESVVPAARAVLHARASAALEARGAPPGQVAHHALEAARLAPSPAARDLALARLERAEAEATRLGAFDAAASLAAQALELDAAQPGADPRRAVTLRIRQAQSLARQGHTTASREVAHQACVRAVGLGDPALHARAALAMGASFAIAVVDPRLVHQLEAALDGLGEQQPGVRAQLMARLASALQPAADPMAPVALAHQALALARGAGEAEALLPTLLSVGSALGDYELPALREPVNRETATLARAAGDSASEHRAWLRLAVDRVELGDLQGVEAATREVEAIAARLGHPHYRWRPLLLRSLLATMRGDFAGAWALVAQARALAETLDQPDAQSSLFFHELSLLRAQHTRASLEEARRQIHAVEPVPGLSDILSIADGSVLARLGRPDEALGQVSPAAARLAVVQHDPLALSFVAEVAGAGRSQALGAAARAGLTRHRHHELSGGLMALHYEGPAARALGLAALAQGALDEAAALLAEAALRCEALGARPLEALCHDALARAHLQRGERDAAAFARDRALALAGTLGLELPSLDLAPSPAAPALAAPKVPRASLSLVREGELWAVSSAGKTVRLKHSKGLAMLEQLVREAGREVHCTELDRAGDGAIDQGDAGEVFDAKAKAQYRARLRALAEDLEDAEQRSDARRAERVREEIDALTEQLAAGVGLGGRARRVGGAAERARVNVQRRVKDAIERIAEGLPELGAHLRWAVRTGTFCSYRGSEPP